MSPRFRILAVEAAERPVRLRLPFRFGDTVVERTAEAYLRLTVEGLGGTATGVAAQLMVPRWFDKRPALSNDDTVAELRDSVRAAASTAVGGAGPVAAVAAALREATVEAMPGVPRLAAGFGPALVEMALIDSACRAVGVSFPAAARADLFGLAACCPPDLAPEALRVRLAALAPRWRMDLRHTVGFDAPLTSAEVLARPDDGPVALSEVIAATGARWFKVKLKGDPEADLARLRAVAAVLDHLPVYGVTLDANEQYRPEAFAAFAEGLAAAGPLARLRAAVAFVEQPFPRETALDAEPPRGLPVVIDESDDADDAWPRARARGYAGTSVKSCKGVLRALLNAARVAENGGILTAEDLTCQPGLCWQQDTAMAATLGLAHIERNGHHFAGGMQGAPEAERRAFAETHPDIYRPDGSLRIEGGQIAFASLDAPGFASDPVPDFTATTPITAEERAL